MYSTTVRLFIKSFKRADINNEYTRNDQILIDLQNIIKKKLHTHIHLFQSAITKIVDNIDTYQHAISYTSF